jgi:hypothetical protein
MVKPRWWVCPGCRSLNDVPARTCYKCRTRKPADPTLLDDEYGEVGGGPARVGISVDVARIAELVSRDPLEAHKGSGPVEDDDVLGIRTLASAAAQAAPPPMREPIRRSIADVGGVDWRDGLSPLPGSPPMASPAAAAPTAAPTASARPPGPATAPAPVPPANSPPMPAAPPSATGSPMPAAPPPATRSPMPAAQPLAAQAPAGAPPAAQAPAGAPPAGAPSELGPPWAPAQAERHETDDRTG